MIILPELQVVIYFNAPLQFVYRAFAIRRFSGDNLEITLDSIR